MALSRSPGQAAQPEASALAASSLPAAPQNRPAGQPVRLSWTPPPKGKTWPDWLLSCIAALPALRAAHAGAMDVAFAPFAASAPVAASTPFAGSAKTTAAAAPAAHLVRVHLSAAPPLSPSPSPSPPHPPAANAHTQAPIDWWLTDHHGRALDVNDPLLDDITAGRGIALALWTRHPSGQGWVCLRQVHLDASTRYLLGRQGLASAAARLLWQAAVDLSLGAAPSNTVHASPRAIGNLGKSVRIPKAPKTPSRLLKLPGLPGMPKPSAVPWARWAMLLRGSWRAWLALQRSRWFREEWRIGVIDAPVASLAGRTQLPQPSWLRPYGGLGYWADPAAVAGSDSRILAEYFDEVSGVGRIEQLQLNAERDVAERKVMPMGEGSHASFPLAVKLDGRWLGLAETAALRACVLHEIDAQGQWQPVATLLPGMAAADPALFQWQGRYWLACTDVDQGAMDNLCLFHAERPEGPWQPHANNPVKLNVTGARMAGALFWHRGELYRPAQNCLGSYGASVMLYRVLRCSPTEFEEEPVRQLTPDSGGPCPDGLHTVNAWGARTLVDGKRHVFSPSLGWLKLRRRLARQSPT